MGIFLLLGWCKNHSIYNIYSSLQKKTTTTDGLCCKMGKTLDMVSVNKPVHLYSEFHLHSPACCLRWVCVDSAGWCTWRFSNVTLELVSITVATLGDIRSRLKEEAEEEECLLLTDLLYLSLWSAEVISYIPQLRSSKSFEEIWHSVNAYIQVCKNSTLFLTW